MISEIKNSLREVCGLKYFWVYMFMYAVFTTIGSIFISAKELPYNNLYANIFTIITFFALGYLIVMVHNILNENNLNDENETFWQSFKTSTVVGLKTLVAFLLNFMGFIAFLGVVTVVDVVAHYSNSLSADNLKTFSFVLPLLIAVIITVLACFYISNFALINFAEKYSIKESFRWVKTFKGFFKKPRAKKTWAIIGIYFAIALTMVVLFTGVLFLFNLVLVFLFKMLLAKHFVILAFLMSLSGVVTPFVCAMFQFVMSAVVYNLLAKVYKESLVNKNVEVAE